jgi:hypothetical protein
MYLGASKTGDRLVLVFGRAFIVIQFVLDIEASRRASESGIGHHHNMTAQAWQTMM